MSAPEEGSAAEVDALPLLPRSSLDADLGAGSSYGAVEENDAHDAHDAHDVRVSGGGINHAHAYHAATDPSRSRDTDGESHRRVSYWNLMRDRWYLLSYLVTHAGEWFTYVASIAAIEEIQSANNITSRTSISILVSLRLLPSACFTSIGGVLADTYDRRTMMWLLDLLGSLAALLFLLAYHIRSIGAIYLATALQMTVAALYEPSRSAIVPMLVTNEASLKKAMTLSELSWSLMTAVGSSLGGLSAEALGISMCFCIDSVSYLMSAVFIWRINGSYVASEFESEPGSKSGNNSRGESVLSPSQFTRLFGEGLVYLRSKAWGPFVFFKACAALIYGSADVLNVTFSERRRDGREDAMEGSSHRLGMLFAFVGVGCFLGPVIADFFTRMDNVQSLERACLGSFLLMALGCYGLSWGESFWWICAFTAVRSAGSSVVWVYSSLLLQKFSSASKLGRVMSVDYALATGGEAFSAMLGGLLQDSAGLSAEQVSFLMTLVALATVAVWTIYLFAARV